MARRAGNANVDEIVSESGLHIKHEGEVRRAYTERQEVNLFSLFFTRMYCGTLMGWTNDSPREKGSSEATAVEFDMHMGLEIAMGILPITEIKDFWSEKKVFGSTGG